MCVGGDSSGEAAGAGGGEGVGDAVGVRAGWDHVHPIAPRINAAMSSSRIFIAVDYGLLVIVNSVPARVKSSNVIFSPLGLTCWARPRRPQNVVPTPTVA